MGDPPSGTCSLCGGDVTDGSPTAGGRRFCCQGCRDVAETLGAGGSDSRDGEGENAGEAAGPDPAAPDTETDADSDAAPDTETDAGTAPDTETDAGTERAYLRVDGMHSPTCEAFLESVARRQDGVVSARASYVTETVRVEYVPAETTESALVEALSGAGYTAYPREAESAETGRRVAGPGRDPRLNQERGLGTMLGFRYAAGVLFGTFLLLPYVALLYPTHLAGLVDWAVLDIYERAVTFTDGGGFGALRLFAVVSGIVLLFTGLPLLRGAYVSLRSRRPDTNLLVAVTVVGAYLYSVVAGVAGRTDVLFDLTVVAAAAVVAAVFYESLAKQRAMDRLTELTVAQVDEATLYVEGATTRVPVESLSPGDRVLVGEGERIPVDGVLESGPCTVDEAVVTGESLPVARTAGDEVVGGSVVTDGAAVVVVDDGVASSMERLVRSVWELQSGTHGIQRRVDRLSARILPAVAVLALLAAGVALVTVGPVAAALAGLATPVVASPWLLGLATPLSVATSIEAALERGVVVFDETVFERLRGMDVVVFDKTGTLTTGEMEVVDADAPAALLGAAAHLERRVSHPVADAVVAAFGPDGPLADGGVTDDPPAAEDAPDVESFVSHGDGVGGVVDGREVLVGHPDRFAAEGWTVGDAVGARVEAAREAGRLPVVVGRDGRAEGVVVVGDEPRPGWEAALTALGERGVEVVVLTGDDERATAAFEAHPQVAHVFASVPPAGKTAAIERLQADNRVTMVGDGTNDAPALARADLGVSLGSGTALASDAADLVVVDDDLATVGTAFDLADAARRRLVWNSRLALLYNAVTVPLALGGFLNPLLVMGAVALGGGLVGANSARDLL